MCVALELIDLRAASHGEAGIVSGFNHRKFDKVHRGEEKCV